MKTNQNLLVFTNLSIKHDFHVWFDRVFENKVNIQRKEV